MVVLIRSAGDYLSKGPAAFGYGDMEEDRAKINKHDLWDRDLEDSPRTRDDLYYLLARFVSLIDGIQEIREFRKQNDGMTYLNMVSGSDIAYFCAVAKSHERVWDYEYRMKRAKGKEKEKYDNPGGIEDEDERKFYTEPNHLFTGGIRKRE